MSKQKYYTPEEVEAHSGNSPDKSIWVVYKGSVYDVTNFISEHPGGEEVILDNAGKDMTDEFDNIGHSSKAHELLSTYKIGELKGEMSNSSHVKLRAVARNNQGGFTILHLLTILFIAVLLFIGYKALF